MEKFLIQYTPPRETFVDDITESESAVIERHFEYLKKLLADDKLIMAGRTDRGEIGIAVIIAENYETADNIMQNDPAVKEAVFTGQIYPFHLALLH